MNQAFLRPLLPLLLPPLLLAQLSPLQAGEAEARVHWHNRLELGFLVSGLISEVPVRPGQQLAQGAVLARLDGRIFAAELSAAEAALKAASLDQEEAQRELDRATELYDRGQLSDHEKQVAQIALAQADSRLEQAKAAQARAAFRAEQAVLRAPFAAEVLEVSAAPGQGVHPHCGPQTLLVLADAQQRQARFQVQQAEAKLQPGQPLQLQIQGRQLQGEVSALRPLPEYAGKEQGNEPGWEVDVVFSPGDLQLAPGSAIEVRW
ncbi:MAG: HlyD family efflux transporter periplasmic adaptor subunit [Gammaproteobacteria bacterium]|nr:HlyD family efflux transporter periplasmic adaptor subunit [Gammaproteobacteria bacterium]